MCTLKRYLFLALSVLLSFSCQEEIPQPVAVQAIYLNATSMELTEGEHATLVATISPNDAENKTVIWSSSNLSIASVSDGKVTALKAGKATITVKTDDGGKTATCEVTVNAKVYPVTGVTLDKTSVELTEGDELTLTATVNPDNATNKNVTWSSSDNTIASVSSGKVTALKAGKATITVKTDDGGKTATCEVTDNAKVYPVTGVTLDKTSVELTEGDELTLTATVNPDNATNKNLTWSSSDDVVASVSNGKITALKAGKATITVKTDDGGKTATCEVIVVRDPINDPIVFADDVMKGMCVNTFDTNGDGELSYKEASEVKSISKMTLTDKSFKSFNEFQYFTSVTSTPNSYFEDCLLMESITLPKETTSMGWNLFGSCKKLSSINIPEGVKVIWYQTFEGCSGLSHVSIPQSVTEIRGSAFRGCSSLVSIDIPKGVKSIENTVFMGCSSLKNVNLPEGLLIIESGLFQNCSNLEEIYIPNSVNTIEYNAFDGCKSLKTIDLPSKIMIIPSAAFMNCSSLSSIAIPENVIEINERAFKGCSSLSSIVIPENVTQIGNDAFRDCTSLSSVYLKAVTPPTLTLNTIYNRSMQFDNNASSRKIYVPNNAVEAYKSAEGWSELADDIVGYNFDNNDIIE